MCIKDKMDNEVHDGKLINFSQINVYYGLRPKQKESFDVCKKEKYGIITDTCGSGKSYIEFELMCNAIQEEKKFIVLAAHRLDLIDQHLDNFEKYLNKYHPNLKGKYSQFEISSANRADKNITNTTRVDDIRNYINGASIPTIITVCYNSIERLYNSFDGSPYRVDLMICDEGHWGMSGVTAKDTEKFSKYSCIRFCDSFLIFTATPFKQTMIRMVDDIEIKVIHDYSYAEATADGIVLPFHANFYTADYGDKSSLGMINTAFKELKNKFTTSAKLLVCGTGLEKNQLHFNSLVKAYKSEIEAGTLAICKIGSSTITEKEEKIPACEFVNKDQYKMVKDFGLKEYKFNFHDERINKFKCIKAMHDWINQVDEDGNPIHRDIIIIHCQMLGVGVDVPNINGVCILGNKESADLYQSIMRPCRISYFDRGKAPQDRLEAHFEVFIHAEEDIQKEMKSFVNQLADIGGLPLIEAMTLGSVSGTKGLDELLSASAKDIYSKTIKGFKVVEECSIIFDVANIELGFQKAEELCEKYPDHIEYIREQIAKFVNGGIV